MFTTHFFQQVHQWFTPLRHWLPLASAPATPAVQVIVQPGDTYFLAAGLYHLRVLTGELWLPEQGILTTGVQHDLRVDWRGLEVQPVAGRPVVFTLCSQL